MTASMVGDSNLEKILSAEIVNKMSSSSSSANKKKVPSRFYSEDNSDEDEWGEDVEVEVEIKDNEDNSPVKRLSSYHDTIFLSTKAKSREDIERRAQPYENCQYRRVITFDMIYRMAIKIVLMDDSTDLIRVAAVSR
ncbi:hypothetical protein Tco_1184314 [Tanacetum coccineum]